MHPAREDRRSFRKLPKAQARPKLLWRKLRRRKAEAPATCSCIWDTRLCRGRRPEFRTRGHTVCRRIQKSAYRIKNKSIGLRMYEKGPCPSTVHTRFSTVPASDIVSSRYLSFPTSSHKGALLQQGAFSSALNYACSRSPACPAVKRVFASILTSL